MCRERDRLAYKKEKSTTEMGYVAHLTRLAQLIVELGENNELIGE